MSVSALHLVPAAVGAYVLCACWVERVALLSLAKTGRGRVLLHLCAIYLEPLHVAWRIASHLRGIAREFRTWLSHGGSNGG